jgi:YD repeat-containing protein
MHTKTPAIASHSVTRTESHSYQYDRFNRLTGLSQTRTSDGTVLSSYTNALGPAGNRTAVQESSGRSVSFSYDALYRLTQESITGDPAGPTGSITYAFDTVGNLVSRRSTLTGVPSATYTYDANDRQLSAGETTSFDWDANGNLVHQTDGGSATTTYAYDPANRLTSVTLPGTSGAVTHAYDGLNNRIRSVAPARTRNYLVDPFGLDGMSHVLRETDDTAVPAADYVFGADLIGQSVVGGSVAYVLPDGQGSTRGLLGPTGATTDSFTYDAFGTPLARTGSTPTSHVYAGQRLDPDTGRVRHAREVVQPGHGPVPEPRSAEWSLAGPRVGTPIRVCRE